MSFQRSLQLFNIDIPIIQAGMVWCSGWRLASAVSNSGGLGIIGAGSMHPDNLRHHIRQCKEATQRPFAVNVPLLYPEIGPLMDLIVEERVPIVFTSAGNPATWTPMLRQNGVTVVHVVSSVRFALKAEQAGCQAVVAEGFEAGGHNGREETTTLCLVPMVCDAVSIPVIAAGGIASGRAMVAMEALGASGVQVGTRFAISKESSAHLNFKEAVLALEEGGTQLALKKLTPVRLIRNKFFEQVAAAEAAGAEASDLHALLGKGRARRGMFEGDLDEGELEIGQIAAALRAVEPAADILNDMWTEYKKVRAALSGN
ncbi:MAG: nitronate monooxygenase [Cyclobacteriaceae bacterium]